MWNNVEELAQFYCILHSIKVKMINLQRSEKVEISDRDITILISILDYIEEEIGNRIDEEKGEEQWKG